MRPLTIVAVACAAGLLLTGCSGGDKTGVPPSVSATPKATAAAIQEAPARDPSLGTPATIGDETAVRATALAYRQPLASAFPPERKGYTYAGVDARVCIKRIADGDVIPVSADPWTLVFDDDTMVQPVSSWSDDWFRVPLYPHSDRLLRPGACVRGWVLFEVPKTKRPVRVSYAPDTGSGAVELAKWRIAS